jgi:glyoxylase-like metal-dependent hydrolase (beta-lactamase superfamily II)
MTPVETSLTEVGAGVFAYLQKGSWGYSNAGLLTDRSGSLLVDTLYDLRLTRRMLDAMRAVVPPAGGIRTVVNTHANGDHFWGNQLVGDATIISSRAAAEEMTELSPALMATLVGASRKIARSRPIVRRILRLLGRVGVTRAGALADGASFIERCFGSFEFRGISLTLPTRTFDGTLDLSVGDRRVQLIEVGPAHTRGDVVVYLPDDRVVFTGDILFIGSHPIVWEGPVDNWIRACDRILALDVDVVVPGHGPVTDKAGVRQTREYWARLVEESRRRLHAGLTPSEIARQLFAEDRAGWTEAHRLAVNVDTICRGLGGRDVRPDPLVLMARMAELDRVT